MRLCDHLTLQFREDLSFDYNWWRMDFLQAVGFASLSAAPACAADIVIICAGSEAPLAAHIKQWFESWTRERFKSPGVLVDLTAALGLGDVWATKEFLREAAHKAGLDYLEISSDPADNSINPFSSGQVHINAIAPGLEFFLNEEAAPEHSGLNE
jgi:hypothetical protein